MSYYQFLTQKRGDSPAFKEQVEVVTHQLTARLKGRDPKTRRVVTDEAELLALREGPVLMVGQVQSGKTRAFLAVMAKCFDEGYDVAIIMTKGTRLLGLQTFERVKREFSSLERGSKVSPIGSKQLRVFDIDQLSKLVITPKLLKSKLVFVVIKEDDNLLKLRQVLMNHPELMARNTLLIDDEADHGTLSSSADRGAGAVQSIITEVRRSYNQRDRRGRSGVMTMLQVTATPVDLYFQRDKSSDELDYISLQPDYAHLLTPHKNYIGGEHYFERSEEEGSVESYLWNRVSATELVMLRSPGDPRRLASRKYRTITSRLKEFKACFVSYLVAGTIRYLQAERRRTHPDAALFEPSYSSAYVIHISRAIEEHGWQKSCLEATMSYLMGEGNEAIFEEEVKAAYEELTRSINAARALPGLTALERDELELPKGGVTKVFKTLYKLLQEQDIQITVINSSALDPETDVVPLDLLVEDGQLALTYTFNVFIGAQSIDRGITVDHLISFYYGRASVSSVQVDSILQHARWYGARSIADLAVTRLHANQHIYDRLRAVYEFDKTLRADLAHTQGALKMVDQTSIVKYDNLSIIDNRKNPAVTYHKFETRPIVAFYCKGAARSQAELKTIVSRLDTLLSRHLGRERTFLASERVFEQLTTLLDELLVSVPGAPPSRTQWDINSLRANMDLSHNERVKVAYWGERRASFHEVMRSIKLIREFEDHMRYMNDDEPPKLILIRVITEGDSKTWGTDEGLYVPVVLNSEATTGVRFIGVQDAHVDH